MQKSKLTMLALILSPLFISGAAMAATTADISVVTLEVNIGNPTISSGEIDIDEIDEALNGGGNGEGGGGGR